MIPDLKFVLKNVFIFNSTISKHADESAKIQLSRVRVSELKLIAVNLPYERFPATSFLQFAQGLFFGKNGVEDVTFSTAHYHA